MRFIIRHRLAFVGVGRDFRGQATGLDRRLLLAGCLMQASKQALPLAIASLGTLGCRVVFTRPQSTLHDDQNLFS